MCVFWFCFNFQVWCAYTPGTQTRKETSGTTHQSHPQVVLSAVKYSAFIESLNVIICKSRFWTKMSSFLNGFKFVLKVTYNGIVADDENIHITFTTISGFLFLCWALQRKHERGERLMCGNCQSSRRVVKRGPGDWVLIATFTTVYDLTLTNKNIIIHFLFPTSINDSPMLPSIHPSISTSAMSLLYECINTVISGEPTCFLSLNGKSVL